VHCIVTGGGLADDGSRWVAAPGEFLFPVRVLAALFRGKVLDGLARARRDGKLRLAAEDEGRAAALRTDALHRASWIVYAKRPFGGPEQVYRSAEPSLARLAPDASHCARGGRVRAFAPVSDRPRCPGLGIGLGLGFGQGGPGSLAAC
jgi:Putative transposase